MGDFAERLLAWHALHGRHDLPWQHPRTAYRVWLSEIMLQQTQVATVIGFFSRFVAALPDLPALAAAEADRVLALWAGLGYYSRARNLHAAARICVARHGGELPRDFDALAALPGIGRSTAGAILAQAHGLRFAILDGNVRRVLARHALIEGSVASAPVLKRLWGLAEQRLPQARLADYSQAVMDLGASVCNSRRPRCGECPVAGDCAALAVGAVDRLPQKKTARVVPERSTRLLVLEDAHGRVLLERRPPAGIWGGLWSLPEMALDADPAAHVGDRFGASLAGTTDLPPFTHAFTHFRLHVQPLRATLTHNGAAIADNPALRWVDGPARAALGLPRPVAALLDRLEEA
jgi:A/G-specific adenine glycosylase